jgi:N-acetylglutamate synthase-like GNAT family acetyltransferase
MHLHSSSSEEVFIRSFQAGDEAAFRTLNEQWIRQYFKLEAKDQAILDDPQEIIIKQGGQILFAIVSGQPVGCCALLRMSERQFEVSKLAVAPGHRGKGIGHRLLGAAIAKAKRLEAHRLYLETNRVLTTAIRLYESVGFRHLDPNRVTPSPYDRTDVYMELLLS